MYYKIYKNGEFINRIKADPDFAEFYCQINGFTYTEEEEPTPVIKPEPDPMTQAEIEEMLLDQEYRILLLEYGLEDDEEVF